MVEEKDLDFENVEGKLVMFEDKGEEEEKDAFASLFELLPLNHDDLPVSFFILLF